MPRLIAHRGYAARHPENTLPAVEAALRAGACYVEVDVQLSADGMPVLLHDASLARTAGIDVEIFDLTLERAERVRVNADATIPSLAALVELLRGWPRVTAFIEIKEESLARCGTEYVVERTLAVLAPCAAQCVPISFDHAALEHARRRGAGDVGWVLRDWNAASRAAAEALAPEYLFCNHTRLPPPPLPLWKGPWRWALYEITDPELALALAARGADLIETMDIVAMLSHPVLCRKACLDE
ncbi:MAG: glycerophosphodiester phosphodiesterase [Gammaproteobacteria bacterium]|nr:glycerophosphodiester phosphodiesterase [Gammaproteobacteria bacterium]